MRELAAPGSADSLRGDCVAAAFEQIAADRTVGEKPRPLGQ
jgi:hypothetical protein